MTARITSQTDSTASGWQCALPVRRGPGAMRRAINRGVSAGASIKDSATEFFTDVKDGIQKENMASQFDTKWVMSELTKTEELGQRGELLFAGQALLILLVLVPPVNLELLYRLLGLAGIVSGLAIAAAGGRSLGKNLTPLPAPRKEEGSLIKDGMYNEREYRYMRHPMYTGIILFSTGVAATSADSTRMLLALSLAALLVVKSEYEEKGLIEVYGDEYKTYQSRVKRFGFL